MWEMHDFIFAHQEEMDRPGFGLDTFEGWASSLGMNAALFGKTIQNKKILDRVASDHVAGDATHLQFTPTFYLVSPTKVTMITGLEDFEKVWKDPTNPAWK